MASVLSDSWQDYTENIKLVLLFSIPFLISFLIPLLAPLPTFVDEGAIFLRSASIFTNINAIGLAVILISSLISLLFLSFAIVAISLIVKAKKTHTQNTGNVIRGIEKYTAKAFVVLLAYALILMVVDISSYYFGLQGIATPILGFILFIFVFYAPVAIVVDNKKILAAIRQSVELVISEPANFAIWLALIVVILTALDFVSIHVFGTFYSTYVVLVINSLLVMPYFILFQAEAYMRRFPVLKR